MTIAEDNTPAGARRQAPDTTPETEPADGQKRRLLKDTDKRVIGIVNQKGGVGKTVTCMNLSSALAIAGQKVLIIDGDPQGNLTLFFMDAPEGGEDAGFAALVKDLARKAVGDDADAYIRKGVRENLSLMPMFDNQLRIEISDAELLDMREDFTRWIQSLKSRFDWILFDCSPSNGRLERMIVGACDAVVVPLEFQLFSVSGLNHLIEDVHGIGREMDRSISVEALVFTKIDNRLKRVRQYRELFNHFQIPVFEIARSEIAARALEEKITLWEVDIKPNKISPEKYNYVCMDYYRIVENLFIG